MQRYQDACYCVGSDYGAQKLTISRIERDASDLYITTTILTLPLFIYTQSNVRMNTGGGIA
jgi:hypothetical protein